jgi:Ulp1 family protease
MEMEIYCDAEVSIYNSADRKKEKQRDGTYYKLINQIHTFLRSKMDNIHDFRVIFPECAQQTDGKSCGLFVIATALALFSNQPVPLALDSQTLTVLRENYVNQA